MTNQTLEYIIYGMPGQIATLACLGTAAVNGFYRGYNNMTPLPEDRSQMITPDKITCITAGIKTAPIIAEEVTDGDPGNSGYHFVELFGLTIAGAITYGLGYFAGNAIQKYL